MKKFLAGLVVIILSLAVVGQVWAVDAVEARNPEAEPVLLYGRSTNDNGIKKFVASSQVGSITGSGQIYTGACRVFGINFYSTLAGDTVGVYNTPNNIMPASGLEFELGISSNNSSQTLYLKGAMWDGIRIWSTNASSYTTVMFDY